MTKNRTSVPPLPLIPANSYNLSPRLISIQIARKYGIEYLRLLEIQRANSPRIQRRVDCRTVRPWGELGISAPGEDPPSASRVLDGRNGSEVGNTSRQVLVEDTQKVQGEPFSVARGNIVAFAPRFCSHRCDIRAPGPSCDIFHRRETVFQVHSVNELFGGWRTIEDRFRVQKFIRECLRADDAPEGTVNITRGGMIGCASERRTDQTQWRVFGKW